jgi:serine protease
VKFRRAVPSAARLAALASVRASESRPASHADFEIVIVDPEADAEAVAETLGEQPGVEYAQARYRVHPTFVPNDPLYARQWNFPALDMERAWDLNPGSTSDVVVAVLDSGVAYRSDIRRYTGIAALGLPALGPVEVPFAAAPELGGPERFVAPFDFIWNSAEPLDLDGHGTHVAGTIGQLTNNGIGVAGMAFNVRIMPVKVVDAEWDEVFDSPNIGTDDVVARAIRYAADSGARVVNMSFGREGAPAPAVREAVEYAVARGTFVVVAAGNEFEDGNRANRMADFAAEVDGMVAVAATGRTNLRAYYSTTGAYVELAAPGGDSRRSGTAGLVLQQTFDAAFVDRFARSRFGPPRFDVFAYDFYQGTSMAAPHVSGFAALLYQQGITSPAAIEAIMKRYATDLGTAGRDNEYGYGLINPRAALRGMGLVR